MNIQWMLGGITLFALFVGGMIVLAQQDQNTPQGIDALFVTYAEELGLDTEKFLRDMNSDVVQNAVGKDVTEAETLKLNATPTFFVNGDAQTFQSVDELQSIIDTYKDAHEKQVIPDNVNHKGSSDPLVIITEYSDFQCPACSIYAPVVKNVLEKNADTVSLVYRHFPLTSIHQNAAAAARAAEAAALQGKFWEMHDLLFERQDDWS